VCPKLSAFVSDLHRFSLRARPAIEEHPLQIYISAIVFAPTRSLVRRRFERLVLPKWLKSLPRVPKDWTLSHTQSAFLPYQTSAFIVKLSPDRKQLASVSRTNSIQLWDSYNGAWQRSLVGHLASINSIIFSSQGEHLFSASYDSTVRQWCTRTGRLLRTFESRTGPLFGISLSTDGNKVAAHSIMGRSNMWKISTGSLHISEGGDM
jgi:WD40 repeat protein